MSQKRFNGKHPHVNIYANLSRNEKPGRGSDTAKVVAAAKKPALEPVRGFTQDDRQKLIEIFKIKFPPIQTTPVTAGFKGTDATSIFLSYLQMAQPKTYQGLLHRARSIPDPESHERCLRLQANDLLISAGLKFMLRRGFDLERAYEQVVGRQRQRDANESRPAEILAGRPVRPDRIRSYVDTPGLLFDILESD